MVEFHGFPTLMVPIVFYARRVSKMSVISSLIVQNSKIINTKCCHTEGFHSCDLYTTANYLKVLLRRRIAIWAVNDYLPYFFCQSMALFCDHSSWDKNLKREYHLASLSTHHSGMQVALKLCSPHQLFVHSEQFPGPCQPLSCSDHANEKLRSKWWNSMAFQH